MNLPGKRRRAPVVRVQGIEAAFPKRSYAPGEQADLQISADTASLRLQVFYYSSQIAPRGRDFKTAGTAMTDPVRVDWRGHRDGPGTLRVVRAGDWPSGLYFMRLTASDGRVGYAPFVVRRPAPRSPRRGRALDEHVAGLQLLGRKRRRLGRQLVRERRNEKRRPRAPVSRLRRPVPLPRLGSRLHRLAEPHGEAGRLPLGRRPRGVHERRPTGGVVRPRRLPRACGVRDPARLRRRPAVPRPRREPHVPRGEQLLLEGAARPGRR